MKRTAKTLLGLLVYLFIALYYSLSLEPILYLIYLVSFYIALLLYSNSLKIEVLSIVPPTSKDEGKITLKIKNNFLPFVFLMEPLIIGKVKGERKLVSLAPKEERVVDLKLVNSSFSLLLGFKVFPFAFPLLDYSFITLPRALIISGEKVLPKIEIKKELGSLFGGEYLHKRKASEGFEFYGIEKYNYGPARYINWKKTAQMGEIYSNVFLMEGHRKVLIGVINSVINLEKFEEMEKMLFSLIKMFKRDKVYIMLIDSLGYQIIKPKQIKDLLKVGLPIRDFHPKIKDRIEEAKEKVRRDYNLELSNEEILLLGLVKKIYPYRYKVEIESFVNAKADIKILITTKDYPMELANVKTIIV